MSMLGLAVGLVLLQTRPVYPDRAAFLERLEKLPERAAKADVLAALGKPDRIETQSPNQETWFYGTDGAKGAATLAQFDVYEGKIAYHPQSLPPPTPSVISEVELRTGLHLILDHFPTEYQETSHG